MKETVKDILDQMEELRTRLNRFYIKKPRHELVNRLTPQQSRIVSLLVTGLCNKDIAEQIGISEKGVKHHLTIVYKLFQVKSRSELIVKVMTDV